MLTAWALLLFLAMWVRSTSGGPLSFRIGKLCDSCNAEQQNCCLHTLTPGSRLSCCSFFILIDISVNEWMLFLFPLQYSLRKLAEQEIKSKCFNTSMYPVTRGMCGYDTVPVGSEIQIFPWPRCRRNYYSTFVFHKRRSYHPVSSGSHFKSEWKAGENVLCKHLPWNHSHITVELSLNVKAPMAENILLSY